MAYRIYRHEGEDSTRIFGNRKEIEDLVETCQNWTSVIPVFEKPPIFDKNEEYYVQFYDNYYELSKVGISFEERIRRDIPSDVDIPEGCNYFCCEYDEYDFFIGGDIDINYDHAYELLQREFGGHYEVDPPLEEQKQMIKENPFSIACLSRPSEEIQLLAVELDTEAYQYIYRPFPSVFEKIQDIEQQEVEGLPFC